MPLRLATSPDLDAWDSLLQKAVTAPHVLQSRAWGEFKAQQGWKPHFFLSETEGECWPILGLTRSLPLTPWQILYFPKLALPTQNNLAHLESLKTYLQTAWSERHRIAVIKLELEQETGESEPEEWLQNAGFSPSHTHPQFRRTMWIDLKGTEDALLEGFKSKTRYNIRLAERKGVEVTAGKHEAGLAEFLALYRSTSQRQHFPMRKTEYYEALWQKFAPQGTAHLLLARHEGELLAGVLLWRFANRAYYLYGASGESKRNLMPTYLLQWEAMRWAKQNDATLYDMVGLPADPDPADPFYGVYQFKLGFQGEIKNWLGAYDLVTKSALKARWPQVESLLKRISWYLKKDTLY